MFPLVVIALMLGGLGCLASLPVAGSPRLGASAAAGVPVGRWRTFANGDDVLSVVVVGQTLWAGTRGGGLVRWDLSSGTSTQFLRPQDALAGNTVNDIAVDGRGRLWLATDGGLTMLDDRGTADRGDDVWRSYTAASTARGLPSDDVRAVAVDGTRVWVGAAQVKNLATGDWLGGGLGQLDTMGTDRTDDDRWAPVSTFDSTIKRGLDGSIQLGLVSDNINDILVTPNGNLWVATSPHWSLEQPADVDKERTWTPVHGGLSFRDTRNTADPSDDRWTPVSCDSMQFTVTCTVHTLALDAKGYVWAAIGGRGVMYFQADDPVIVDERSRRWDASDGLADNFVESIAFGPRDNPALANTVWLGTRDGGISVLDHKGSLRDRSDDTWNLGRAGPLTTADGLARNRIQALAIANGGFWLGTGPLNGVGGGIQRLDPATDGIGAALVSKGGPPSNFITDVDFGRPGTRWAGHVWLGTGSRAPTARRFGSGAVDLDTHGTRDASDDVWTTYNTLNTDDDGKLPWTGLVGDNIHAVAVQGDRVWFGSTETRWNAATGAYADGGLALFDGTTWTARRVDNTGGPATGHRDGSVSALATGCKGELWVGMGNAADNIGGGLAALTVTGDGHTLAGDAWQNFVYPELPSDNITDVSVDCGAARVWASAAHHDRSGRWEGGGVGVRDLQAGKWSKYDTTSGLESYADLGVKVKAEAESVLAGANGTAWVGTYGTRRMGTDSLVKDNPYWPAVLNTWSGQGWSADILTGAGWVSSIARDPDGRVWLGTSRGGIARKDAQPESWVTDRLPPPGPTPTVTATPPRTPTPGRTPTAVPPRTQPGYGGGLFVVDGTQWYRLDTASSGIPSNDVSVVAVGPDGDVWVGTEGWGLARLEVGADPPTPTATNDAPTSTATLTATDEPTATPRWTSTPAGSTTATPTASRSPSTTANRPGWRIFLPVCFEPIKRPR
jgi:hypothetical protein